MGRHIFGQALARKQRVRVEQNQMYYINLVQRERNVSLFSNLSPLPILTPPDVFILLMVLFICVTQKSCTRVSRLVTGTQWDAKEGGKSNATAKTGQCNWNYKQKSRNYSIPTETITRFFMVVSQTSGEHTPLSSINLRAIQKLLVTRNLPQLISD